jgi:hypothetical protein
MGQSFGGRQEGLGGNTATVEASAAYEVFLHQGDRGTQAGRPQGGHVAAGAATQHYHAHWGAARRARAARAGARLA